MDNLFLEEFIDNDQENVKEIKIGETNMYQINNDNVIDHVDDYGINTQAIIHKQDNISEDTNESKIYDISKLFTKEITKERLLLSYEDMNASLSFVNFNGSYECEFKLNKTYKNVIGFRLDKAIYENIDTTLNGSQTNIYLDVIINNIPNEACINNLKGYNIIKRLPYEYSYVSNGSGVNYNSFYMKGNYFYPINLDKLNLSLKYNHKESVGNDTDLIDLRNLNNKNYSNTDISTGLKFSFEFELTLLNR